MDRHNYIVTVTCFSTKVKCECADLTLLPIFKISEKNVNKLNFRMALTFGWLNFVSVMLSFGFHVNLQFIEQNNDVFPVENCREPDLSWACGQSLSRTYGQINGKAIPDHVAICQGQRSRQRTEGWLPVV